MIRTVCRRIRRYMPGVSLCFFLLAAVSGFLHLGFVLSTSFADRFNSSVAAFFRGSLAHLTGWIPFSLAETLILFIPVIFVALLILCIRRSKEGWRRVMYCVSGMLSVIALLYTMFVMTFAAGYHTAPLDEKLGLEKKAVSADQLAYTAVILANRMEEELDEILFFWQDSSVMPYGYDEMSSRLMDAYNCVTEKYPFIQSLDSRIKPIMASEPMTYTHISGVYTMFTGEANVNVNYPDYIIPYAAAHELAHQRGIARENEANFVAFLVCLESDDPYIRYSCLLNMYEFVSSALYSASRSYYTAVQQSLDLRIRHELYAYSRFYDKYRDTVVSTVSETVNNAYLVMQGTEGTKSYGMVVDLAVAYLLEDGE